MIESKESKYQKLAGKYDQLMKDYYNLKVANDKIIQRQRKAEADLESRLVNMSLGDYSESDVEKLVEENHELKAKIEDKDEQAFIANSILRDAQKQLNLLEPADIQVRGGNYNRAPMNDM